MMSITLMAIWMIVRTSSGLNPAFSANAFTSCGQFSSSQDRLPTLPEHLLG